MQRRHQKNSVKKVKGKTRHSKDDALSEIELNNLIDSSDDVFDKLIIMLAGYEGMRESEIAHMNEDWIDFQDEIIIIPKEMPCTCGECKKFRGGIWKPKTEAGARMIPIRPEVLDVMSRYFTTYSKIGCSRQTVWNRIKGVAKETKITKRIYPHSLRATAGTLWGQTGLSGTSLCKIMGWTSIETANDYVNADMESAVKEARWRLKEALK